MRLANTILVVLAAVFLAGDTAVSKAHETGVSNVDFVLSSDVLAGEDKRLLRSHQTTVDEAETPELDEEERGSLFAANILSAMTSDLIYRFEMFMRWKTNGYLPKDLKADIPKSLYKAYKIHYRMN